MGEPSAVLSLAVVGCMGVFLKVEYGSSEIAVPESIRAL